MVASETRYGLIRGLRLRSDADESLATRRVPAVFLPLLQTEHENVYVWRPIGSDDEGLHLVTEVSVADARPWKTVSSCLGLALFLASNGEAILETCIQWLDRFDPHGVFDDDPFSAPDDCRGLATLNEGSRRFSAWLPVVEALVRDDALYLAAMRLRASLEAHWVCLHCVMVGDDPPEHPAPEPENWQLLDWSVRIESGLLQAIRACEGLLGQPNSGGANQRTLSRWRGAVDIDPHTAFPPVGQSMVEYYAHLFSTARNTAAHGFSELPLERARRECVDAQHFAWLVAYGRYLKVKRPDERANDALRFNAAALD